jgi:hypothetical protein
MGTDLAVDEFEAAARIGDLFAETGSKFGEEVAVFAGRGFGVQVQLGDLAGEQCAPLSIDSGDIALCMLDLARDAKKLGGSAFAGDGGADFTLIVKETLQGFGITPVVGLIGAGHQQGEVSPFGVVAREVGVDALGDVAKKGLKAGWWIELFNLVSIAECGLMSLLCTLTGLLCSTTGGVGVVEIDFAFGNARFDVVKFSVKDADLAEVTAFKGPELGTDLGKLGFALSELGTNGRKLLALIENSGIVRGLLENDFGWHTASASGTSSLTEWSPCD